MLYNSFDIKIKKNGRDLESDNKVLSWFKKEKRKAKMQDKTRKYIVTMVIDLADKFDERKSDKEMLQGYLQEQVQSGVVDKKLFRQHISLFIRDVKISVMELE